LIYFIKSSFQIMFIFKISGQYAKSILFLDIIVRPAFHICHLAISGIRISYKTILFRNWHINNSLTHLNLLLSPAVTSMLLHSTNLVIKTNGRHIPAKAAPFDQIVTILFNKFLYLREELFPKTTMTILLT